MGAVMDHLMGITNRDSCSGRPVCSKYCSKSYVQINVYYNVISQLFVCTILSIVSTQNGVTPLMAASFHGHVDIVRMLIEAKAQVNTQYKVSCSSHQKHTTVPVKKKLNSAHDGACTHSR